MNFSDLGIKIGLPTINGIASKGIYASIGFALEFVMGILMIIWVGFSIYGAYKIITSDMAKGFEEGTTIIKNVWIGITMGIVFFIILSVVGGLLGVGDITRWHTSLAQCHDASGGFYFKDVQEQVVSGLPEDNDVYCCLVKSDLAEVSSMSTFYKHSTFQKDTWHYIVVGKGESPNATYFNECEKF